MEACDEKTPLLVMAGASSNAEGLASTAEPRPTSATLNPENVSASSSPAASPMTPATRKDGIKDLLDVLQVWAPAALVLLILVAGSVGSYAKRVVVALEKTSNVSSLLEEMIGEMRELRAVLERQALAT